jgi:hypothetical protein
LSTAGATIDATAGIIKLNISRMEESFTFKPKVAEQCNQVMVMIRPERNAMTPDKKPTTAEKKPERNAMTPDKKPTAAENFSRCVKNATSAVTSSLVAPAT